MPFSIPRCVPAALAATSVAAQAAAAASLPPQPLMPRNECMEGADKVCYGIDGGQSQNLDVEMVQYAALYLRYLGQTSGKKPARYTMPALGAGEGGCQEWAIALPKGTGILLLAKHTNPSFASSVTYEDMADSIDGSEGATDAERKAALLGCGTNGGQRGVVAKSSNPAYQTQEYKSTGAKPEGIVIKLIGAPDF
ncbi:hypothetical protein GGTG_00333 [Gaeumannomyces tritici R3-111a-1]|uniref:Uncharacterized protein n=1 Tax=Gaeumannomyces tritici (strain R3-111a-1) TaxID=644352 RepID=J3NGE2_GAET3|nr:hypothetical protein GGTG_00333 [Gaeumannomyces tritici R3-111a-1]EJT80332.1 hypothetical protein GGTG_00333 [Gaeumannomyces tritici R3-111a-1]